MKYCKIKMMMLTCLLLLCSLTLSAQEGITKTIFVDFVNLDAFSSYEELNDFQMDYSQYQLRIAFWWRTVFRPPTRALFIFNSSHVEDNELVTALENDIRVNSVES